MPCSHECIRANTMHRVDSVEREVGTIRAFDLFLARERAILSVVLTWNGIVAVAINNRECDAILALCSRDAVRVTSDCRFKNNSLASLTGTRRLGDAAVVRENAYNYI